MNIKHITGAVAVFVTGVMLTACAPASVETDVATLTATIDRMEADMEDMADTITELESTIEDQLPDPDRIAEVDDAVVYIDEFLSDWTELTDDDLDTIYDVVGTLADLFCWAEGDYADTPNPTYTDCMNAVWDN